MALASGPHSLSTTWQKTTTDIIDSNMTSTLLSVLDTNFWNKLKLQDTPMGIQPLIKVHSLPQSEHRPETRYHLYYHLWETSESLLVHIPPSSCHSPGVTKSLIYGAVTRAYHTCTHPNDWAPFLIKTLHWLQQQGHNLKHTLPAMLNALRLIKTKQAQCHKPQQTITQVPLILHLPYNPLDVSASTIYRTFKILESSTDILLDRLPIDHTNTTHSISKSFNTTYHTALQLLVQYMWRMTRW